jgi:hypothetical protein
VETTREAHHHGMVFSLLHLIAWLASHLGRRVDTEASSPAVPPQAALRFI